MKDSVLIEFTQAELQVLIFALRLDLETVGKMVGIKDISKTDWNEYELMQVVYSKLCLYVTKHGL